MERFEFRKKAFLQPPDLQKAKQLHENFAVELRKQRRVERYLDKRARQQSHCETPSDDLPAVLTPAFLQSFLSVSPDLVRSYLFHLRYLCAQPNPPLELLLAPGLTAKVASYLSSDSPEERVAASWIFINLASSTEDRVMREIHAVGALRKLVECLGHPQQEVVGNSLWALANYASDGSHYRNDVLVAGILDYITVIGGRLSEQNADFCELFSWLLCNLTKTPPQQQFLSSLAQLLVQCVQDCQGAALLNSLTAAYQLTVKDTDCIEAVLSFHIAPVLITLFAHSDSEVRLQALRVAGNICAGTDRHTDCMLKQGLLDAVSPFLCASERVVKKEALWLLSNVLASDRDHVEMAVRHRNFQEVLKALEDPDLRIRKEALACLSNLEKDPHLSREVWDEMQGLERVCGSLEVQDTDLLRRVVETLVSYTQQQCQLTAGTAATILRRMEAVGAICRLDRLLHHSTLHAFVSRLLECLQEDQTDTSAPVPSLLYQYT